MGEALLSVKDLNASAGEKQILHDIDLDVPAGETHVLMGPNGAGKSTLGKTIMGSLEYKVTQGTITFDGEDITKLSIDKRSRAGLFISFQSPVEVPGVPLASFLLSIAAQHKELKLRGKRYKQRIAEIMDQLDMDEKYLTRELNVGFSGGEKKKIEMMQLLLLQPKLAILDETDSGLDVDALNVVSRAIQEYKKVCNGSLLIITHNTRLLDHLHVDRTHVIVRGHIMAEGDGSLVDDINKNGFEQFGLPDYAIEEDAQEAAAAKGALADDDAPAQKGMFASQDGDQKTFDADAALKNAEAALDAAGIKGKGGTK